LHNGIQHYAWGDRKFIPALLGLGNAQGKPCAELWMGAHPDLPSEVEIGGQRMRLDSLIANSPADMLGDTVAAEFDGQLPYLLKVLSAAAPLSIQTHPSKSASEAGFAREEQAGIPLSAPHRNYRDRNHKPELIVALTDFYALCGFRPLDEIAGMLRAVPGFSEEAQRFEPTVDSLRSLYETWMTLPQPEVDSRLTPYLERLRAADGKHHFQRNQREYWLLEADKQYSAHGRRDRGLFSICLLNLVHLKPGAALALSSGVLHAYLEGSGMELMANSNNVLRGGLTPKHVDVPELLRNVNFDAGPARPLQAERHSDTEWLYRTPYREFELARLEVAAGRKHVSAADHSADILFVASAHGGEEVKVACAGLTVSLRKGSAVLVRHNVAYRVETSGSATVFRARVPHR
jgi:mannose-6-phosphate isomerase class I